ncbi:AIPR family protein [Microbacterium karelineae]|uniref:AIPR family protein n=1 Tax=Microbacterium karelineae TaxID=2654283 RepID=UPI0012E9B785|nr:AIPR family protein [Microbacterium karelineae]
MSDFYDEFANSIHIRAEGNSAFRLEAFGYEAADRLETAEVVQDLTIVPLQCRGRNRSPLRILGYAEDTADSSLVVMCSAFYDGPGAKLTKTDARVAFKAGVGFIEQSADGYLGENLEISSNEAEHATYFRDLLRRDPRNSLGKVVKFKFILVTDGTMSDRIRSIDSDEVCGRPATYSIWDLRRFEDLAKSESGQDDYDVDITKWLPDGLPCLPATSSESPTQSYLAVIPGHLLAGVFNEYGSQLLESNVRTFLSARGKVNRGIQRTLANEPEMFLAYNNGLTTTATGVVVRETPEGPRITSLHNWQIVNGGQTTASLAHFIRTQRGTSVDHVSVPMKLVTVAPEGAADVVSSISRYANSQNAVSEADLFSNSPFHVRLEQISRRLRAPAPDGHHVQSKWFYERARGQWENQRNAGPASHVKRFELEYPKKQRVTKTDWAKYAFSWSKRPHEVSRGAQSNFMAFAKLAAEMWEKDEDQFGDAYFRAGVAKAIIFTETRTAIMASEWYGTGYLANIVTYAVARFAYELEQRFPKAKYDLEKVWRTQGISAASRESLVSIARSMSEVLTDPTRPQANVTQWAKQEEAWKRAQRQPVTIDPRVEADLVDAAEVRARTVDAKRERVIDTGLEAVTRVMKVRKSVWADVLREASGAGVLSPTDLDIIKVVTSGAIPSDRQATRAWRALERCVDEGFVLADDLSA